MFKPARVLRECCVQVAEADRGKTVLTAAAVGGVATAAYVAYVGGSGGGSGGGVGGGFGGGGGAPYLSSSRSSWRYTYPT